MTRKPQIKLTATIDGRSALEVIDLLLDGETRLTELHEAVADAIRAQHPHHVNKPIVAIRYSVANNAS